MRIRNRCQISWHFAAILPIGYQALAALVQKGAADLLRCYGTLEGILAAGRLAAEAEMLRLYQSPR